MVRRSLWGAALILALAVSPFHAVTNETPAAKAARPSFKITFPTAGYVVNNGTMIFAELGRAFPRSKVRSVLFEVSPNGSDSWRRIRAPGYPGWGEFTTLWDANRLAGGDYFLRAKLLRRGDPPVLSRNVRVVVNEQPSALVTGTIKAIDPTVDRKSGAAPVLPRTARMVLDANGRDPDGQITSIQWDFGDGTTGEGMAPSHNYPAGTYKVSVTVKDDKGGVFTSQHDLTVTDDGEVVSFELHKEERCGCNSMDVVTTGSIEPGSQLSFQDMPFGSGDAFKQLGPYSFSHDTNYGSGSYEWYARCRFLVVAEFSGDPSKCAEGARWQYTRVGASGLASPSTYNSSDPRYDSSKSADDPYDETDDADVKEAKPCEFGSQNYCDAGQHGGGGADGTGIRGKGPPGFGSKEHRSAAIGMAFAPGVYSIVAPTSEGDVQLHARFEAIVSGPDGTCTCTWEVHIVLTGTGNNMEVLQNEVTNENCTSSA